MNIKMFTLIKYDEFIPIFEECYDKATFDTAYEKACTLYNNSRSIALNEDFLTGIEKSSVFFNEKDYSKELECEILRPITVRQIACVRECLNALYDDSKYYESRPQQKTLNVLNELKDSFIDLYRCNKKKYISYSEALLFGELLDRISASFKNEELN